MSGDSPIFSFGWSRLSGAQFPQSSPLASSPSLLCFLSAPLCFLSAATTILFYTHPTRSSAPYTPPLLPLHCVFSILSHPPLPPFPVLVSLLTLLALLTFAHSCSPCAICTFVCTCFLFFVCLYCLYNCTLSIVLCFFVSLCCNSFNDCS